MPVPSLSAFDPTQFFHLPAIGSNKVCGDGSCRADAQVQGIALSNDLSGRLSLTTAEGDKITLSANLETEFQSVSYQSRVEANGGSVEISAQYAELSMRKEFGVTVDGDLNEQEVRDLAKLFRRVTHIFKKYFSGQDEEALAKTAKLADGFAHYSTLTGLDFAVDVQRSVTAVVAQLAGGGSLAAPGPATTVSTETGTPGAAPSTAIPPPSSATTAPTAHVAAAPTNDKLGSLVAQVLEAMRDATVESGKLNKYLSLLLNKMREDLEGELKGQSHDGSQPLPPTQGPSAPIFAYQSTHDASFGLSIHT